MKFLSLAMDPVHPETSIISLTQQPSIVSDLRSTQLKQT